MTNNYNYSHHYTYPTPPAQPDAQQARLFQQLLWMRLFETQTQAFVKLQRKSQQNALQAMAAHHRSQQELFLHLQSMTAIPAPAAVSSLYPPETSP